MSGRHGRRAIALDATHTDKLSSLTQKLQPYTRRDAFATRMGITAIPRHLVSTAKEIAQESYEPNNKSMMKVNAIAKRLARAAEQDDRDEIPGLISELTFAVGSAYVDDIKLFANSMRSGGFSQLDRHNAEKRATYEKRRGEAERHIGGIGKRAFGR
jgi:replicative DNA helicase